jgi:hypothetical protein
MASDNMVRERLASTLGALRGALANPLLGTLVVFAVLSVVLVPWQPFMPASGLDPSWKSVIEWAFLEDKRFGRDIVFTFGPLGFLYGGQYHPSLYPLQLLFWEAFALLAAASLGRYWARTPVWLSAGLVLSLVVAAGYQRDQWLFLLPLLAALQAIDAREQGRPWITAGLVAMTIVAGLSKFTVFLAAVALFAVADLLRASVLRSLPVLVPTLLAGSWVLFGFANGSWDWPSYLLASFEIASGYSAAMQVNGPTVEIFSTIGFSLAVVAVAYLTPVADNRRDWLERSAVSVAFGILAFLLFKAGVVRHDGHILITAGGVILLAAIAAWRASYHKANRWIQAAAAITLALAVWSLLEMPGRLWRGGGPLEVAESLTRQRISAAAAAAYSVVFGDALGGFEIARSGAEHAIRAKTPLPALDGTVDIYNWDQADVLAHGLDYSPRPVFQSYSAYTPGLVKKNVDHLVGDSAPDYVLFDLQTIDNRLSALEDGASWPSLWSRYDAVELTGHHVLLARRQGADRPMVWGDPRVAEIGWGQPLSLEPLASDGCAWAEVNIGSTLAGRLLTTAFKAPMVELELELADGSKVKRRFIPGMGETGFLLSPYVDDLSRFIGACNAGARGTGSTVRSAAFHRTERAGPFFKDVIRVTTRSLHVQGRREVIAGPSLRWLELGSRIVSKGSDQCAYPLRWQEGKVFAHAPCHVLVGSLPKGDLEIAFGIFEGAWNQGQTNGVRFELQALRDGQWQRMGEKELRPREIKSDRLGGKFQVWVDANVEALSLTTDPLGDASWDWSYWGPIVPRKVP